MRECKLLSFVGAGASYLIGAMEGAVRGQSRTKVGTSHDSMSEVVGGSENGSS